MTDSLLQTPIAKWPPVLAARLVRWWHLRARAPSEGPSLSAMLRRSRGAFVPVSDQAGARRDRRTQRGDLSASKAADHER